MAEQTSNPRRPHPRPRPGARKAFLIGAAVLALTATAASGFSIATIRHVESKIVKIGTGPDCTGDCLKHVQPQCVEKICNFLILGSDSRKGFNDQSQVEGQRADTIILVQVDPKRKRTIALSIPRDLRVPIPGHGEDKINTAFTYSPDTMVQAVSDLTGLEINHYIEVNFAGFEGIVNALGGVPICIDQPMLDQLAGLNLPHRGCYDLKGAQALAFVRARHIQGDVIPDFSRISRQQQFIRAVIQKMLSIGAITHLTSLIQAVQDNLILDKGLDLYALQDLTRDLALLGQGSVIFRVVPAVPVDINGESFLQLLQPNASKLFERIRKGEKLGSYGQESVLTPISPANVTVHVLSAGNDEGAQEVFDYLGKAGFLVTPVEPAPAGLTRTAILWGHDGRQQSQEVLSYLPELTVLYDNDHTADSEISVVVGPDFSGVPAG